MSVLMTLVIGIFLGRYVPAVLDGIRYYLRGRKMLKALEPLKLDPTKLCKSPHTWIDAATVSPDGESAQTQVCRACGFVSGTDMVLTPEQIKRIEEDTKIEGIEKKLYGDFLKREDDQIKEFFDQEIKGGLDFNKLAKVHGAGMSFGQRYALYRMTKAEEVRQELTRGNA